MRIHLRVWRQASPTSKGGLVAYTAENVSPDMSFLEMLDVVNEGLIAQGRGPDRVRLGLPRRDLRHLRIHRSTASRTARSAARPCASSTCARSSDGDTVTLEPWRAKAFPVVKDLVVDRSAFDRIIQAGGYTSVNVGGAQDANAILIPKPTVEQAMDAAACIGCGACVAACKNASAALFTSAKVSHLALLPQGQVERSDAGRRDGRPPRRRGLRQLLERRRVRSGLPEGDLDHEHRADEPRAREGDAPPRPVKPRPTLTG